MKLFKSSAFYFDPTDKTCGHGQYLIEAENEDEARKKLAEAFKKGGTEMCFTALLELEVTTEKGVYLLP